MSCNCKKKTCHTCNPKSLADLQAQVAQLGETLNQVLKDTKYLSCAHPIQMIQQVKDIAQFDVNGLGSGCWEGWAMCLGKTFTNSKKETITVPNLVDRFVVMATGKYAVGATGGTDTVKLSISELPVHLHPITDPGHTHAITDPGHGHGVTDPGHNHTQNPHTHDYNDVIPDQPGAYLSTTPSAYTAVNRDLLRTSQPTTAVNNTNTTGLSVNTNTTSVTANNAQAGIETTNTTGNDVPHENRPPYFALIFVMKL